MTQRKRIVGPRYDVATMKLRGEPRIYFVVDRSAPQFTYPNARYASAPFTTAIAAERECLRLNREVMKKRVNKFILARAAQ